MAKNFLNKRTLHFFLLLLILSVAIANRFYGLDRLSLWADELWVVMESSKGSLFDMFAFVRYHDNHPPGHYLLTRYWQMAAGDSDFVIRLPFAIAGIFLVYSTYRIGKEHYSAEAGLIGAALISSSWQAIFYSQEARANILVAVAALWTLNYFYRLVVTDRSDQKNMIGFWLTATLCCYLHYVGTVFVACLTLIFLAMLVWRRQKSFLILGFKLFIPVTLLYSPWLTGIYYHLTHTPSGAWWETPEWAYLYENFKWIYGFGSRILLLYQAAFLFLLIQPFVFFLKRDFFNRFSLLLLVMVVLPVLVFFIKSRISQPVYDYRHFIYTMPFMAMAAGWLVNLCFMRFRSWIQGVILAFIVIAILLVQNYSNIAGKLYLGPHFKAEYRQSVTTLARMHSDSPAELALVISNSNFFNHYLRRLLKGRSADYSLTDGGQIAALNEIVSAQNSEVIYFLEVPETRERNMVSALDVELAKTYRPICRTRFVYAQIIKFSTENPLLIDWEQLPDCN